MKGHKKVIVRIKGGLGNQLFAYSAARRLAYVNNAELVIDHITGFVRDRQYRSQFGLDRFHISARRATAAERLEPFERYRRGAMRWSSGRRPFARRGYVEQEELEFDERLLALKVQGTLYLEGYWQSERYFKDIEKIIRMDLRIVSPTDCPNQETAEKIRRCEAVGVHVRWFDAPGSRSDHNVSVEYYRCAFDLIESNLDDPQYFLFSDNPDAASEKLGLPAKRMTVVRHNGATGREYADLWLMSQCRHVVTANSTFSWWGAWLGTGTGGMVITPKMQLLHGTITSWNFPGQIPGEWTRL